MLRVKYQDTGQEELIDAYASVRVSSPTNRVLDVIVRFTSGDNQDDYAVVLVCAKNFLVQFRNHPVLKAHTHFFLTDKRGEKECVMYVWAASGPAEEVGISGGTNRSALTNHVFLQLEPTGLKLDF